MITKWCKGYFGFEIFMIYGFFVVRKVWLVFSLGRLILPGIFWGYPKFIADSMINRYT